MAQLAELCGQLPLLQRSRLLQGIGFVFEQSQIVQRIVNRLLMALAARMAGDDLTSTADRHLIHGAFDQHLAMAVSGGHRVIVAAIAHKR